jgi:hypothetical protein
MALNRSIVTQRYVRLSTGFITNYQLGIQNEKKWESLFRLSLWVCADLYRWLR